MPVAVLVGVGSRHVLGRAKSDVHGLNGPLQLGQQHVVGLLSHAHALEAMHTNQRKSDSLDQLVPKHLLTAVNKYRTTLLKGSCVHTQV